MRSLLDSITGYLNKSALRPVFDKLRLMVSYLNDVYRGYYTDYSIKHYVIVIAAIIYVLSPMDAIPDLLPVVSPTDDATVIGAVFLSLKDELSRYSKWRNPLRHVKRITTDVFYKPIYEPIVATYCCRDDRFVLPPYLQCRSTCPAQRNKSTEHACHLTKPRLIMTTKRMVFIGRQQLFSYICHATQQGTTNCNTITMSNIKAIFFDIDGTLVSFKTHRIPASTLDALERLREKGIKLFIATRPSQSIVNNLGDFNFDGYVTLNGGVCIVDGKTIFSRSLPQDDTDMLIEQSRGGERFPCIYVLTMPWPSPEEMP